MWLLLSKKPMIFRLSFCHPKVGLDVKGAVLDERLGWWFRDIECGVGWREGGEEGL